jgi:hypothetical protein
LNFANLTGRLNASLSLNGTGDLGFVFPSYVFAGPVLGGQAAVALVESYGRVSSLVTGTLSGSLATPLGSTSFMRSDSISDTLWGFSDLVPQFSLRWNAGVNNFMTYITGDIPVDAYDSTRLANIGIGHGAIDAGGGYTSTRKRAMNFLPRGLHLQFREYRHQLSERHRLSPRHGGVG